MVRIFQAAPGGAHIGLEAGKWLIETGRGSVSLEQPSGFVGLLPLLERPYSEMYQDLREALEEQGISPDLAASFPAHELVSYALRSGSAYWKEQAFTWLSEVPASDDWIEPLESICENRAWPQKLRQDAARSLEALRQRVARQR